MASDTTPTSDTADRSGTTPLPHVAIASVDDANVILQHVARLSSIGGWALDIERGHPIWTEQVYRLHEVEPGTIFSIEQAINFYVPEDRALVADAVAQLIEHGTGFDFEARLRTTRGRIRWVRAIGTAVNDERTGKRRVLGAVQDITETKLRQLELDRLNQALHQRNALLEEFVYSTSHDLKSPLINIGHLLERLWHACEEGDRQAAHEAFTRSTRAVAMLQKRIDDLLASYSIGIDTAGKADTQIRLDALLSDILCELDERLTDKGCVVCIADELPIVNGDEARLRVLFHNLLSNAVQHGGDPDTPRIQITHQPFGREHIVSIEDNGPGLDEDAHRAIVSTLDSSRTPKAGEGVGLAIATRIAQAHGGSIQITGHGPQGTVFAVTLPEAGSGGRPNAGIDVSAR